MPDPRFFEDLGPVSLSELADVSGARLNRAEDGALTIRSVAPLTSAGPADIGFFSDRRYRDDLISTRAGACFLAEAQAEHAPAGCALLFTNEAQGAYAKAANRLFRPRRWAHGAPSIHPDAELEEGVQLAPGAIVGAGAQIGRGTYVGPHAVIGPGVALGRDCVVSAHAVISFALIGDRVTILSGAKIGEPGFGVTVAGGATMDVPQLGRVIIQDGVSIGAETCIDRGAWDDTVIGENTKIDNLVQIAHNVRLGRSCLIAAHTGISGSCVVGDGAVFGGAAGIADHINIGAGARVAAAAGVMRDIPAGEAWLGAPARPARQFMRETAWVSKMAQIRKKGLEDE